MGGIETERFPIDPSKPRVFEAARVWRLALRKYANQVVWLYAIQAGADGPVKIGITVSPWERLLTLQQGNHETLIGRAAWRGFPFQEKLLHAEFASARIRGEWFHPVPELLEYVDLEGGIFCDWEKPCPLT